MSRRELILASAASAARDFVFYDRKEDEELPRGSIQDAIAAGEITVRDIVTAFEADLRGWGGLQ